MDTNRSQVTVRVSGGSANTCKSFEAITTSDTNTLGCECMLHGSGDTAVLLHAGAVAIENEPKDVQVCTRIVKVANVGASE